MAAGDVSVSFPKVYRVSPNDGTVSGGVTIEDGAMKFDGVNGGVTISNLSLIGNQEDYTIAMWVKRAELGVRHHFLRRNNEMLLQANTDNTWEMGIWEEDTGDYKRVYSSALTNLDWVFVVGKVFYNSSENKTYYKIKINNQDVTFGDGSFTGKRRNFDTSLTIANPTFFPMNGSIDDILIFNRALSQDEITQLYNQGRGKYSSITNGLVAQYSGRDFAGTEAVPTKIYDTKEVGLIRQDTSFIDTAFSEMRVNANSKFLLVKGHKNQVYVTHIEEA